jgi:hypothetical protein
VFRYADRRRLVNHAYQRVRRDLRRHMSTLGPMLERHGLKLRPAVLMDGQRSFQDSLDHQRRANARVLQDLERTLKRLQQLVAERA